MLELYLAYADYRDLMDWIEKADPRPGRHACTARSSSPTRDARYDLAKPLPARHGRAGDHRAQSGHRPAVAARCRPTCASAARRSASRSSRSDGAGKLQIEMFEKTAEAHAAWIRPSCTPTRRRSRRCRAPNDADPFITDRFEFFIGGRELANGFSELNDPEDQAARFRAQVARKDSGRRGGDVLRRRLRARARVRHAADRGPRASASTGWSCSSPTRPRSAT